MEAECEYENAQEQDYGYFKEEILRLTGIDLHAYKEKQMKRRINTLIGRRGFRGYAEYVRALENDPREMGIFTDYITINVTEFFRTAAHWAYLEETVLPELIQTGKRPLKIWSSACSTGEEPYSLVMSMARYLPPEQIRVLATDIDRGVLAQAAAGVFSDKSMENVPEDRKKRYFTKTGTGWEISREIRECVEFRRLDLLREEYPGEQDLIVCRNVLIYFTEEAQSEIFQKFHDALSEDGYLFTGNAEQIIQYKRFGFGRKMSFAYKKMAGIQS